MPENSFLSRLRRKKADSHISRDTWMVVISLILIFALALFLRSYFGFGEATAYGTPFLVSGGSDSYYHERAIDTAVYEHHSLIKDPMLNYPVGSRNPRPPNYDWSVVLIGYVIAPFVGGNIALAISYSLMFSTALWGALTIFPTYLIGKKMFGRKVGLISAFFLATLPAHMTRSPITDADHDSFVLFFMVTAIYFLMVALEHIKEEEWVGSWRKWSDIKEGMKRMGSANATNFLYAGLSAASIIVAALTWTGFSYIYLIIFFYFIIQIFITVFRKRDPLTITSTAAIVLSLPLLVIAPYYLPIHLYSWILAPTLMTVIVLFLGLFFSFTKRLPWTLTMPSLFIAGGILFGALVLVYPGILETIGGSAGYFTHSKLYRTIAEAQAPFFSNLVLSFGPVTFFLALIGVGWIIWKMRKHWEPYYVFFVLWSGESTYMALSAARFMFNAAPSFAIAAAWITYYIIKESHFGEMKKTYRSLRGNKLYAIKKSVKVTHVVVVLFLVFMILLPNVWYSVDAGMPSNEKKKYDSEVYNAMPDFMRPPSDLYNSSSKGLWYFGAFGYALPTPNQYWPAAWKWFAKQDSNELPQDRPGFLSWWDYGFECIQQGKHPAVADNFQNGYQIAGNFIMAQNESDAVSLLAERILDSEYNKKDGKFSERSISLMEEYLGDNDTRKIIDIYRHPESYVPQILAHPEIYGPHDSQITELNARYIAARGVLMKYSVEHIVDFLHALEVMTGKSIRYFAIDSRLIPFSAQNTGIFYAPAVLSDQRISSTSRVPYDYYNLYAITKYGKKYPVDAVPDNVRPDIDHTEIEYEDMFYKTMLYRAYFGYTPKDGGSSVNGLPGLSEKLKNMRPMPGWNLTHFRLVYRTAYWNPYTDYKNHSDAWQAVSMDDAIKYEREKKGVVDMSAGTLYNGVTFLEYYEGAIVNGTVLTPDGKPVGGVRVTVYDDYGIPHESVISNKEGKYSIIAPFGNVTLLLSTGGSLNKERMTEKQVINRTSMHIERYQAFRDKIDANMDGKWDYLIEKDPVVSTGKVNGTVFLDMNNNGMKDPLEPGEKAKITLIGKTLSINYTGYSDSTGHYEIPNVVPGDYDAMIDMNGYVQDMNITITVAPNKEKAQNLAVPTGEFEGKVTDEYGNIVPDLSIRAQAAYMSIERDFTTDSHGNFSLSGIVPGIYDFLSEKPGYALSLKRAAVGKNATVVVNLTAYPASTVNGYVTLNGKAVPYLTLNFVNYSYPGMSRSVTTGSEGEYSIYLPAGGYTVSATYIHGTSRYVLLKYIDVRKNASASFSLERAYSVSGYIRYTGYDSNTGKQFVSYKDQFPVTFTDDGGMRMDFFSVKGNYTAYVPAGNYHVYVSHSFALFPYASSTHIEVTGDSVLNIDLKKAVSVKGKITGALNMPLRGALLRFDNDATGDSFETMTDRKGNYDFELMPGNYTVTMEREGYNALSVPLGISGSKDSVYINKTMVPRMVDVQGTVRLAGLPKSGITVTFIGYNSTFNATSGADGSYSIPLYVGEYEISVEQNVNGSAAERYELVSRESLLISAGDSSIIKDINIELRDRVSGNILLNGTGIDATIWFSHNGTSIPYNTVNGSFELYLPPSDYVLNSTYMENSTAYGIFRELYVKAPVNITLNLTRAYYVSISISSEGKTVVGIPIELSVGQRTSKIMNPEGNTLSMYLPSGEYHLHVNYTRKEEIGGMNRSVTYSADRDLNVQGDTSLTLELSKYIPEGSLDAGFEIAGTPVKGAEVHLVATEGGKEYNYTTDSEGNIHADLPLGLYILYTEAKSGDNPYAVLEEIGVKEKTSANITMDAAVTFSGKTVTEKGMPIRTNITMIDLNNQRIQRTFMTDSSGNFNIAVPPGSYSVVANTYRTEYGIRTQYIKNFDVNLTFSASTDIVVSRVNVYNPQASWDSREKETVMPGTDVEYHITVKNAGNTNDTYTFSGTPWKFDFSPSSVSLAPEEQAKVTVTVHVPKDAKVNHEPIKINVNSGRSPEKSSSVTLDVGVLPVRGVEIENISSSSWVNGSALYAVDIKNTGNSEDVFSVAPSGQSLLSQGWKALISDSKNGKYNESADMISIPANSTQTVYVKLVPVVPSPSYSPELPLKVQSMEGTAAEKVMSAPLPSLEIKSGISISGGDVHIWEPKPIDLVPVYWAIGIVVFLAALYVVLKKKGVIM